MFSDIKEVWVERGGVEVKVAFELIKTGDIVIANAKDTVAVDGTVISGDALVDESSMSGESVLIKRKRGDRVISGTLVKKGAGYGYWQSKWANKVLDTKSDPSSKTHLHQNRMPK